MYYLLCNSGSVVASMRVELVRFFSDMADYPQKTSIILHWLLVDDTLNEVLYSCHKNVVWGHTRLNSSDTSH